MSSYFGNILPAHMSGNSGPTEVFYPRTETKLDTGNFHTSSHNMCFDNENGSYGMGNYNYYPTMYDRIDSHNQLQPMNLVSKQPGYCHGGNGTIYQYQNTHNYGNHIQGNLYQDERPSCIKSEENCIPTPPPSYPSIHEQHHQSQMTISGQELHHPHLGNNPAALNGISQQNMQVFPWMRAAMNGGIVFIFSPNSIFRK